MGRRPNHIPNQWPMVAAAKVSGEIQQAVNEGLSGITTLQSGHILVGNASNVATDVAMSGDATIANTGVVTLAISGVTPGTYTNTTLTVDAKGRVTTASSGSGGLSSSLTSAHIFVGNGSGIATDVAASGDATIANTGAVTVAKSTAAGFNVQHYANIGSLSAPTNTTDGDLSSTRLFVGDTTTPTFISTPVAGAFGYAPANYAAGTGSIFGFASTGAGDAGGTTAVQLLSFRAEATGTNSVNTLTGMQGEGVGAMSSGTLGILQGVQGVARITGAAAVTTARALNGILIANGGATITNGYSVYAQAPNLSGGSTVTNQYGIRIDKQKQTGVTNGYGIRQVDTGDFNRLAGNTTIGADADPGTSCALDVVSTTGAIRFPSMTTTQRNALTASNGMIVYDTTLSAFYKYEGGSWSNFASGSGGGGGISYGGPAGGVQSTLGHATKGYLIDPQTPIFIYGGFTLITWATPQAYKFGLYSLNSSLVIQSVLSTVVVTPASGTLQIVSFTFPSPQLLSPGTLYGVACTRTDSTTTAVLNIQGGGTDIIGMPASAHNLAIFMDSTNPGIGNTFTSSAGPFAMQLAWSK